MITEWCIPKKEPSPASFTNGWYAHSKIGALELQNIGLDHMKSEISINCLGFVIYETLVVMPYLTGWPKSDVCWFTKPKKYIHRNYFVISSHIYHLMSTRDL